MVLPLTVSIISAGGNSLYRSSFLPLMMSFNISVALSSKMLIFVWLFFLFIMFLISCPSCMMCSANFDFSSVYMKYLLCSLNLVMEFLLVLATKDLLQSLHTLFLSYMLDFAVLLLV